MSRGATQSPALKTFRPRASSSWNSPSSATPPRETVRVMAAASASRSRARWLCRVRSALADCGADELEFRDDRIGTIFLESDVSRAYARLYRYVGIVAAVVYKLLQLL